MSAQPSKKGVGWGGARASVFGLRQRSAGSQPRNPQKPVHHSPYSTLADGVKSDWMSSAFTLQSSSFWTVLLSWHQCRNSLGERTSEREGGRRRPTVSVQGARARREGREGGAKTPKTREEDEKRGERQWGAGSRRLLTWQRSSSAPKDSTGRGSGGRIEVCPPSSPPTTVCAAQLCVAAPPSVAKILWIPE